MDKQWFKDKMRVAGVTAARMADRIGRDQAVVSRILNGRQPMTNAQAEIFAEMLSLPLEEIITHAGLFSQAATRVVAQGFSENDITPFIPRGGGRTDIERDVAKALGMKDEHCIWQVSSPALALIGYCVGDYIVVDDTKTELAKTGDVVLVQVYDWNSGSAKTLLRRYEPPVVVAASADPADQRVHIVDRKNVYIAGVVRASFRL